MPDKNSPNSMQLAVVGEHVMHILLIKPSAMSKARCSLSLSTQQPGEKEDGRSKIRGQFNRLLR